MRRSIAVLGQALDVVARLSIFIAAVGLVAMTAMIAWQVWGRYINNSTPSWTEAMAVLVMNWFIFLGAAIGVRENFHMGFEVLIYVLPERFVPLLHTLSDLAILAFGLGMVWYGWGLTVRTWSDHIAGLGIPRGIGYIPLFAGGVLVTLFIVERLARRFAGMPVLGAPDSTIVSGEL